MQRTVTSIRCGWDEGGGTGNTRPENDGDIAGRRRRWGRGVMEDTEDERAYGGRGQRRVQAEREEDERSHANSERENEDRV